MRIHKGREVTFVSIPKCATHSFYAVLSEKNGWQHVGGWHNAEVPDYARKFRVYMPLRNPYDRAVSIWWRCTHGIGTKKNGQYLGTPEEMDGLSLRRFLRRLLGAMKSWKFPPLLFRTQSYRVKQVQDQIPREVSMLRLEDGDFSALGIDDLPVLWPSNGRVRWKSVVGDEEADMVLSWMGEDFEIGGYETRIT